MSEPKADLVRNIEIVIAEDSPTQAEQLEYHLNARGYAVTVARNGNEALAAVLENKPAMVISDVMMPGMDGYSLCKEIKSRPALKDVPVILLTSLSKPQDVLQGLECGADNFIRKPYDEKNLLSRVDYILTNVELRKTERMQVGVQLYFGGKKYFITSEKQQILDLLISTYESAVQVNEELETRQRELARERDLLHTLMDNVPDFIYFKDTKSRFTTINRAQATALGASAPEEALGKTDFDFFTEEYAREAFADEQNILQSGKPLINKVEEARRPDGSSIWVSATKMLIRDVHGDVIGTFGISRDMTQFKIVEEASRLLAEVTAAANSAEHVDEAISHSLETICKLKGWQLGQVWLPDWEGQVLTCNAQHFYMDEIDAAEFRAESLKTPMKKGLGLPGRVWQANAATWVIDMAKELEFPRVETATRAGLRTAFAFPINAGKRLIAIFEFFSSETRAPDRYFLGALENLGSDLGGVFERRYAEEALRASEERFRAVAETANDAIISADEEGNIILWNKGAERTFGYTAAEALGKPLTLIMPEEFHAPHQQGLQRYLTTGQPHVIGRTVELSGRKRDGTEFPLELSLASWKTGENIFFAGVLRDISERKQFEQELQEKNLDLEKANLSKDHFLASMSHELRTPLNAVIGFTGTLLMKLPGPLTEEQSKQLQTIQSSAKHLLSLISDLLDLAKIGSGKVPLILEPVVFQSVVEEVCSTLRPLAEKKGLELNVTVPEAQVVINTDRRALGQILLNLANNAIKFTDRGEVRIVLNREKANAKSWTQLSVHDTGVGIRPEDQSNLFHAFTQVEGSSRRQEGTGLGLHLSQKLAESLGGSINFKSEYGKGSTFTLSLPEIQTQGMG